MLSALALALLTTLSFNSFPRDDSPSAVEDAKQGPLDVCNAMETAAKSGDEDGLLGHVSSYGRSHYDRKAEMALHGFHNLLIALRCVRVDNQDDTTAMVYVYVPGNKSQDVPFIKEGGFWRFDEQKFEQMRKEKKK